MVWCACVASAWRVDVGAVTHQQLARAWVLGGWVVLLVGARIDCWYTHTGLNKVTDAGLKDFSAALGSSSTITTVSLGCKSEWLASCLYEWARVCVGDGS